MDFPPIGVNRGAVVIFSVVADCVAWTDCSTSVVNVGRACAGRKTVAHVASSGATKKALLPRWHSVQGTVSAANPCSGSRSDDMVTSEISGLQVELGERGSFPQKQACPDAAP